MQKKRTSPSPQHPQSNYDSLEPGFRRELWRIIDEINNDPHKCVHVGLNLGSAEVRFCGLDENVQLESSRLDLRDDLTRSFKWSTSSSGAGLP